MISTQVSGCGGKSGRQKRGEKVEEILLSVSFALMCYYVLSIVMLLLSDGMTMYEKICLYILLYLAVRQTIGWYSE